MKPIMVVAGTRPEVIKLAPVIKWLQRLNVDYVFVWSGQHYDYLLSKIFFEEFELNEPDLRETPITYYRLLEDKATNDPELFDLLIGFDHGVSHTFLERHARRCWLGLEGACNHII